MSTRWALVGLVGGFALIAVGVWLEGRWWLNLWKEAW